METVIAPANDCGYLADHQIASGGAGSSAGPASLTEERKHVGRIRTIKPEFPQSESIGRLSRDARLLFIQLWTQADDSGRLRGASRMLASLLYPYDEDATDLIEGWLSELETQNHIRRYSVGNSQYLEIPNFLQHQKIDRPSPSKLPPFENTREDSSSIPRGLDAVSSIKEGISIKEGEGTVPPDSGGELMFAHWLLEEVGAVADNGTRQMAAEAIRLLAKEGGTSKQAAEYILAAAKQAVATGETINRFWFTDQRYRPQKPKKVRGAEVVGPRAAPAPEEAQEREELADWKSRDEDYRRKRPWFGCVIDENGNRLQ